jgi:OmcA/MtrC family decaheme c-type cytochrome
MSIRLGTRKFRVPLVRGILFLVVVAVAVASQGSLRSHFTKHDKAYYASNQILDFVRPGLNLTITGASINSGGTITANFTVADPAGLPLDLAGVTTPGAIRVSFIAAAIPKGQEEYTAYTTRVSADAATGASATQAAADQGGTITQTGNGQYTYTFHTLAPSGFDPTVTHTIGAYASRDLTQFNLGTSYASATYNFVPNGSPVTTVHQIVATADCNACHGQLAFHGGSRRGVELCVLCHTKQTSDPYTGNTLDFRVMIHKIHMGSSLPSVQAGTPYQIVGYQQSVNDFSSVVYPAQVQRCQTCHNPNNGAAQTKLWLTAPSAAACGACHDNVNFATGQNHPGGPQPDDSQCANCHQPQGELPFDASIIGAHYVPEDVPGSPKTVATILGVANGTAGNAPTVTFTVKDGNGNPIPISTFANGGSLRLTMAGPTTDYGYTSFGSDVNTPGYVTESLSPSNTTCASDGTCTYTFQHSVPAGATGTYAVAMETELTATLLPGTTSAVTYNYNAINPVYYFSVDGSEVMPRRTVVSINNCNQCHYKLELHGGLRNQIEYCVMCHNPSNTDIYFRSVAKDPAQRTMPPQGIEFALLAHRIHDGVNMLADGGSYTVVGYQGSVNDFSKTLYPEMSPQGDATDVQNCAVCHVNDSEANLPVGLNNVVNPQGWINPEGATATACSGCHVAKDAAAHFKAMTDPTLGESCTVCHQSGAAYDVDQVHAE